MTIPANLEPALDLSHMHGINMINAVSAEGGNCSEEQKFC